MAPGTALDTGSGPLAVELRDGAGLAHPDSGAVTLGTVTAGSVAVANNGPSAGSDVSLGPVLTDGPQRYANPDGTTRVRGTLYAIDSPVTFDDSVAVNPGVLVSAGAGTVDFAGGGGQTLQAGGGARFGNLGHSGTGALRLLSGLTVTGTLTNTAGTFDANNRPVAVAGSATVAGGTYLAGTTPQTFTGGLVLAGGVFTSSTGPMAVSGGVTLRGGTLSGVGTVDVLTAAGGGMVAPGTDSPGVLNAAGVVTLDASTTFSALLSGTDKSQLLAGLGKKASSPGTAGA
jgi:hypothetical protein